MRTLSTPKNLSVGTKLFGGFGVVLALLVLLTGMSFWTIGQLSGANTSITGQGTPELAAALTLKSDAADLAGAQLAYVLDQGRSRGQFERANRTFLDGLARLAAVPNDVGNTQAVARIRSQYDRLMAIDRSVNAAVERDKPVRARTLALGPSAAAAGELADSIQAEAARASAKTAAWASAFRTRRASSQLVMGFLGAAAVLVGLAFAFLISRAIRTPLVALQRAAETAAEGDLTVGVDSQSTDEVGRVAHAFNEMVSSLRAVVGDVNRVSNELGAASAEMAATSQEAGKAVDEIASAVGDVAQGAERQVRMVEEARTLTEEMAGAVEQSAANAQETAVAAERAREVAEQGVGAVEQANQAMRSVLDSSLAVTEAIRSLGSKSEQIGSIVETITGIAGQTNLLALNAAIEAARAGEQGRGFAVVAEEVRKLAEESQRAAASIAALIGEIQAETHRAVEVVEDGSRRTEAGAAVVEEAREAFLRIGERVEDMHGRVAQIAAAVQQLSLGSTRVQENMTEVAAVAEQSSASTEQVSASTEETSASTAEIATSAQELAHTAEELEQIVSKFKLAA